MKYVLTNCNIIDGKKNCGVRENQMIFVNNGSIEKICNKDNAETLGYEVKDMEDRYIMPGLINMHSHLFGTGKPNKVLGSGGAQKLLVRYLYTSAGYRTLVKMVTLGITQALNSGVTTIRGVGDFRYTDVKVRDLVNEGKLAGPRMLVSGPAITCPTGHGSGRFSGPQKVVYLI